MEMWQVAPLDFFQDVMALISTIPAKNFLSCETESSLHKEGMFQEFPLNYSYQNGLQPLGQKANIRILSLAYSVYPNYISRNWQNN